MSESLVTHPKGVRHPLALSKLRATFFEDVVVSVLICIALARFFRSIDFGTGSSPSEPEFLVTVTMPALIFRDCINYLLTKKKLGLIC